MRQLCSVFRDAWLPLDCTNGGVSARYNRLLVISEDEPLPDYPMYDPETPVCVLTRSTPTHPVIRPHPSLLRGGPKAWTMFGGNYAGTSDSRFIEAVAAISGTHSTRLVSIHDREE